MLSCKKMVFLRFWAAFMQKDWFSSGFGLLSKDTERHSETQRDTERHRETERAIAALAVSYSL